MNTPKSPNPNVWPVDTIDRWRQVEHELRETTSLEPHVRAVVAAFLVLTDTLAKAGT